MIAAFTRPLWILAGVVFAATGIVGIFVPLLPTTPFILLAAACFARGSARCEAWLVNHPRFGPMVRDWRARRAVPRRAKWLATVMMAGGCLFAAWTIASPWRFAPIAVCAAVALWLWRLPDADAPR